MKKAIVFLLAGLMAFNCFAQEVEKLGEIKDIKLRDGIAGGPGSPNEIAVDEVGNKIKIINRTSDYTYFDLTTLEGIKQIEYRNSYADTQIELGDFDISFTGDVLILEKDNEQIQYIAGYGDINSGISFILKKDNGYIIYYVNEDGCPCAVDTTGRIYSEKEAMAYLKEYDPEKYAQSEKRAAELELYNDFIRNDVLIWGDTYYSTYDILTDFWKPEQYLYGKADGAILYDEQGNGYGANIRPQGINSNICINDVNGKRISKILLQEYSNILSDPDVNNHFFQSSLYVGFGGNIYYYIAGDEYTEVFRIRRTWGEPDFYAMAINGYTEDFYGKYVDEVLPTLNKADLRLLRNTIFAIYGVHFKSADLSAHFAKQVWYTDEGKTSGEVTLPAHRQKLVEMIQKLEKN